MPEPISDELLGVDLGDKRLNRRRRQVLHALSVGPQASMNGAFEKWGDTLAAPPSLSEFLHLLASLGGYNNRKTEPPPGPQPI